MTNSAYENLRSYYKPDNVEILFVGESRPQGGTFFYQGDSVLYRETKKAFDVFFNKEVFTLDKFKAWHCWLYDICENPVNSLNNRERREQIHGNIPRLFDVVTQVIPRIIIVCKKKFVETEIINSRIMNTFCVGENIFFLPFPGQGNQRRYREELIKALKVIHFDYKELSCREKGDIRIRMAVNNDVSIAAKLALLLWPDHTLYELEHEMSECISSDYACIFLAFKHTQPIGFAQCQLRHDYVEGAKSNLVGYLEGIFIEEHSRRKGFARQLLIYCEKWAKKHGCTEFASDCELNNADSQRFHLKTGFQEANRVICFIKKL